MKRKITVTTGSRAEYGILRSVLREIQKSKKLDLYLIATGTHLSKKYGLTIQEIRKDGFKIFTTIYMIPKSDSGFYMAQSVGKGILEFAKTFQKIRPDINLILGDRDEMLASAIAAYHMNIPNAHIHGGDMSGGIDEYTRHAITKISNIHFTATQKSKQHVVNLGENSKYVFNTGSPSIDELNQDMITDKKILEKKYNVLANKDTIMLLQHPVTTQTNLSENQILNTIKALVDLKHPVIAIAPNSDAGHREIFKVLTNFSKKHNFIQLYSSLPRSDYLGFLCNCGVLVGNSSSGIIEASIIGTPVVNVGIRQLNRERGDNVIDVQNPESRLIKKAILSALQRVKKPTKTYRARNAGKNIVKILETIPLNSNLIEKKLSY